MLSCVEARELISDYIDGDLEPAAVAAVDGHLSSCRACPPLAKAMIGALAELRRSAPPLEPWWLDTVLAGLTLGAPSTNHTSGETP